MQVVFDWKQIRPLISHEVSSFPTHALPLIYKEYIKTVSDNLATPIEMGALSGLAIVSACIQGKVFVQPKEDYRESINLYILVIAEPGERKSPLLKLLSAPLYEYEKKTNEERKIKIRKEEMKLKALRNELSKYEDNCCYEQALKVQQQIDDLCKNKTKLLRLTADDFTIEALTSLLAENEGRMSVISSEGGMFNNITGRYSNKSSFETLLKAYTGDTIRVDRKGRESELIESALLTILIMAQESVLEGIMDDGDLRGQGFLGRFLYCKPISPMGTRVYDTPPLNHELMSKFNELLVNLLSIEGINILTLSDDAKEVCRNYFNWLEPQLVSNLNEIRDWASKLHGTTLRIAGVLHCIENNGLGDSVINENTMKNACRIAIYCISHAKIAFSIMGTSESVIKANFVLRKLESIDSLEITKRDIYLLCRSRYFKKAEDINDALELLVEHGYIRVKKGIDTNTVGRKPSPVYELNPVHFEHSVQKT